MKVAVPEDKATVFYFDNFFTDDIMEGIVAEANRYAEECITHAALLSLSRANSWRPISADELRLFFGVVFAMGLTDKLDLQSHWSSEEVIRTPFLENTMVRNRFLLILFILLFERHFLLFDWFTNYYCPYSCAFWCNIVFPTSFRNVKKVSGKKSLVF